MTQQTDVFRKLFILTLTKELIVNYGSENLIELKQILESESQKKSIEYLVIFI